MKFNEVIEQNSRYTINRCPGKRRYIKGKYNYILFFLFQPINNQYL